jgi:hypothetical protein
MHFDANFGRNVARFQVADQRVDVNTVTHFHGDFAQVFVGAMHGVAQLQGGDFAPSAIVEQLAGFSRAMVDAGILGGVVAFAEHLDRSGQVDRFLAP